MSNRNRLMPSIALALTVSLAAPALAQSMMSVSAADRTYLQSNAQGSVYDLALAELGMQRATTGALYNYARRVVVDHDRLNLEALDVGRTLRVDLPLTLSSEDEASLMQLMTLRGKAFDSAFLKEEERINAEDVSKSVQTRRTTRNQTIFRFVTDFHATESRHLQGARALMRQVGM